MSLVGLAYLTEILAPTPLFWVTATGKLRLFIRQRAEEHTALCLPTHVRCRELYSISERWSWLGLPGPPAISISQATARVSIAQALQLFPQSLSPVTGALPER